MVNQSDALARLNKEREYEDHLVEVLGEYFISCLDSIDGLTDKEKQKIEENLDIIIFDSKRHSDVFNNLIQLVLEYGENKY